MLLKSDHSLEGDVADDKPDPSAYHQLGLALFLRDGWLNGPPTCL